MFKENFRFHLYERMQQSTVSPLGENKRWEFLQVIPPPNPRPSRLHRDKLGEILRIRFHYCF